METPNKRPGAAVDDILEQLKAQGMPPPSKKTGSSVDDILAEMGMGVKKPVVPPSVSRGAAAAVQPPVASTVPPPPPATAAFAQPAAAPSPLFAAEAEAAPVADPDTGESFTPPPATPKVRGGKFSEGTGSIWDIQTSHTQQLPRVGKAAALDRVDPDKFKGDTELLSWFSEEDAPPTSKREEKQAAKQAAKQAKLDAKEEKRRLAAERKEEKRRDKLRGDEDDDYGEWPEEEQAELEQDDFEPPVQPMAEQAAFDSSFGSAFDGAADDDGWGGGSLFDVVSKGAAPQHTATDIFSTQRLEAVAEGAPDDTQSFYAPPAGQGPVAPPKADTAPDLFATRAFAPPPAADAREAVSQQATQAFAPVAAPAAPKAGAPTLFGETAPLDIPGPAAEALFDDAAEEGGLAAQPDDSLYDTQSYDLDGAEGERVPTAAFTQEFDSADPASEESKSLFLDDMVDDRFRDFFSETVIVDQEEVQRGLKSRRKKKRSRTAILTGEFGKLAELAEQADAAAEEAEENAAEDGFEDYERPQDAEAIEGDIAALCTTLTRRTIFTFIISALLLWVGWSLGGGVWLPDAIAYQTNPLVHAIVYTVLLIGAIAINFTTVASGLVGLFSEPTVDSAPALASVAGLLQGIVLLVQALTNQPAEGVLYGFLAAMLLAFNALGKRVRAGTILANFQLASAGYDHSAAYIVDNQSELAYNITKGLEEEDPVMLVSRPTGLVKGFLRQSFSQRQSDRTGRIIAWVLLAFALAGAGMALLFSKSLFATISAFAGILCIGAPLSSTLVSAIPSALMQHSTARVGAVVPGWSAIEELGEVNVVMATGRDIFPPSAVSLRGIKTFEKERIDIAILYAASVLIEGCDTLRDIFSGVIQGKNDMLYKVESLTKEPGRGFTAWVQNSRVVVGSREMMQKHDIEPPPIEIELKHVPAGHMPVYLAVSGKLFAMFIVGYHADPEIQDTLDSLVRSGVSLLVNSDDMNITEELVERAYDLPHGTVKILGKRELDILEPMTSYLPESDGVMTHIGTFPSFIGGMRAAASCAVAERMSSIVQIASVALITLLCVLLIFSGGSLTLSVMIGLFYQLGWGLLSSLLPFARRY